MVYLNDIIIYSMTKKEHLEYINKVFKALSNLRLYAKLSKYIIDISSLEFCGLVVGNGTVELVTLKVKIIDDWPISKIVYKVRQFLGLA